MTVDQTADGRKTALKKWSPAAAAVLWTCFIWGNSLQTADVSGATSDSVTNFFSQWIPWLTDHIIRKTAHFTEYAVLGGLLAVIWLVLLGGRRGALPLILLLGQSVPLADETIQLFVPGRSGEVRDVLLDIAGVVFGLVAMRLCVLAVSALRRRRKPDSAA